MLNDAMRNIVKIKHRGLYKFNRLNGNYVESFPNGTVKCAGAYIEDNREGDWTWYFETGIIKETAVYKSGQLISNEKFEDNNGN
jgi:antitoxin component YwqK of YwqJK toxin-antitoxin module